MVQGRTLLGSKYQHKYEDYRRQQPRLDADAKEAKAKHGYNSHGWAGRSIRDMAIEVGMRGDYDSGYFLMSDMEHSGVRALDEYIGLAPDGRIEVSGGRSPNWVKESVLTAHLLLVSMAKLADDVLSLGIGQELDSLDERMLAVVGAKRASAR